MTGCKSDAEARGGENVIGVSVTPKGRAGPVGAKMTFTKGGPDGSMAIRVLTRFGRASAIAHPKGPDWEWVNKTTGPIRSKS